jgi:hypothetical protein
LWILNFLSVFSALFLYAPSVFARDLPLQSRAKTLTSSNLNGFKTSADGVDITKQASMKALPGDALEVKFQPKEPFKAQPNLEIKLSGTTKDGIPFETKTVAGIAAKFAVAPIHIIKIPSYDSVLEDATITTPVSVFEHGAVNVLYQEGDKLENFKFEVSLLMLC